MRAKKKKVLASKAEAELASESGVEVSQAPRESVEEIPHEEEERGTMSAALKPEFRTARLTEGELARLIELVGPVLVQLSVPWPIEKLAEARRLLIEAQKRSSRGSHAAKSASQERAGGGQWIS